MTAMRIVVAYATKHGSTGEVAQAIADRLRTHGFDVDCEPAANLEDLEAYDAAVVGGALYMGRWRAAEVESSRKQLEHALERIPNVEPVATAIFGGVVDPSKLRFPLNRMPLVDARDSDAIEAWADALPALVGGSVPASV
jgi:menaquinone-dependent protoporphyrinogen oxidase